MGSRWVVVLHPSVLFSIFFPHPFAHYNHLLYLQTRIEALSDLDPIKPLSLPIPRIFGNGGKPALNLPEALASLCKK